MQQVPTKLQRPKVTANQKRKDHQKTGGHHYNIFPKSAILSKNVWMFIKGINYVDNISMLLVRELVELISDWSISFISFKYIYELSIHKIEWVIGIRYLRHYKIYYAFPYMETSVISNILSFSFYASPARELYRSL